MINDLYSTSSVIQVLYPQTATAGVPITGNVIPTANYEGLIDLVVTSNLLLSTNTVSGTAFGSNDGVTYSALRSTSVASTGTSPSGAAVSTYVDSRETSYVKLVLTASSGQQVSAVAIVPNKIV